MTARVHTEAGRWEVPHEHAIEAYGVRLGIGASDEELFGRASSVVPPGARPVDPAEVRARFALTRHEDVFQAVGDKGQVLTSADPEIATGLLDAMVRTYVAVHAADRIFVHAGVVALEGRAVVLPGPSLSGKTTLVAALVRAGAAYYSEEYAVLDQSGLVHPYPKPLSIRTHGRGVKTPVEALGGVVGVAPIRAGLLAVTTYAPRAKWSPRALSAGEGILRLLANTIPAIERAPEALVAARNAVPRTILEGDRGDADETASALLETLRAG